MEKHLYSSSVELFYLGEVEYQLRTVCPQERLDILEKLPRYPLIYSLRHALHYYGSTGFHIPSFLQQR